MRTRRTEACTTLVSLTLCLLTLAPCAAMGAEEDVIDERHGGWQFETTPYVWLPETHGTIRARDLSADVDVGFDDVFDLLGDGDLFAAMGRFEARKDRLALFVDSMGVVAHEDAGGQILRDRVDVDADVDLDLVAVEFGAAFRLLERGRFALEALAGGRYNHVHAEVEVNAADRQRNQDGGGDFVDPFVGGRGAFRLADQWSLVFRGDVGGFGAGSELAWVVLGGIRWAMPWTVGAAPVALFAGYKVYDLDYESGAGGRKREFDIQMRGPALGLTFTF